MNHQSAIDAEPGFVTIIHRQVPGSGPVACRSAFSRCAVPVVSVVQGLGRDSLAAAGIPVGEPSTYVAIGPSEDGRYQWDAYVGESSANPERLREHARDSAKGFIRTVHVVTWPERRQSQAMARYREWRYGELILKAGVARLVTMPPEMRGLPDVDRHDVDASIPIERILLWDSGCHVLEPPGSEPLREVGDVLPLSERAADNAVATPVWYELRYRHQFGLGVDQTGRFTVKAGTEVRTTDGKAKDSRIRRRHQQLRTQGALAPIRGVTDRQRLLVDVSFSSVSVAARVVAGSHVYSDVWQPSERSPAPIIIH